MDCPQIPVTGSNTSLWVVLAFVVLAAGAAFLVAARRRGVSSGVAVMVAFGIGLTALAIDARTAQAQAADSCPSSTVSPATATSDTTTSTVATTTTEPTTTTTTAPVADLAPTIGGPTSALVGQEEQYPIQIANVGEGPTTGSMSFTVAFAGAGLSIAFSGGLADWNFVPGPGVAVTFTSRPGVVIAPGAVSTVTLALTVNPTSLTSFSMTTTLPTGIGGETNAANNGASHTVAVSPA